MGGFLESLGRSNAFSSINNLAGTAINLKQMENTQEQQAQTNAINLEKLGMAKADQEREAAKFKWAEQDQTKKEKFNKSVVPVDTLLQNARPGTRDLLMKLGKDNGWIKDVAGNLVISNEDLANAQKHLKSNLDIIVQLAYTDVADINKELGPLKGNRDELKSTKPDDKQIPILDKKIADLEKLKAAQINRGMELDSAFQEKKALADASAASKNKLIKSKSGEILQANDQGGYDTIYSPPETAKEPKTDQDRFVEDRAAAFKAKSGKDATPDQRAGWRMEYHRAPVDPTVGSDKAETKEEKRKVKALGDARKEMEKIYGYSQFLPTAQDPMLIEKVGKGKMLVEDIIDNPKVYGLSKEPTPGKAAEMAKRIVDKLYNPDTPPPKSAPAGNPIRKALGLE